MVRRQYNKEPSTLKKFRRLARAPRKAFKALQRCEYIAFRRRLKPVTKRKSQVWRDKVPGKLRPFFETPELAYSRLKPSEYRRFRRLYNMWKVGAKSCVIRDLSVGRYRAFSRRQEQSFIRSAITRAGRGPLARSKNTRQVRKAAKRLYLEIIEEHEPQSPLYFVRKPTSESYLLRVERENETLWRELLATVQENAP